jgi:hypothetical protein
MISRVYREVPAKLIENVPWVNLRWNNKTYHSPKLNSYEDKGRRSFKESKFVRRVEIMSINPVTKLPRITVDVWGSIYTSVLFKSLDRSQRTPDMATKVARLHSSRLLSLGPLEKLSIRNKDWNKTPLLRRIFAAAQHILNHPETIAKAALSLLMRAENCIESQGGHFEQLLWFCFVYLMVWLIIKCVK